MQQTLYPTIASGLAVALLALLAFLGAARTWLGAVRGKPRKSRFASHILFEPGQRLRRELAHLDSWYGAHLGAILVYFLVLGAVLVVRPAPPPFVLPDWAWIMLCALVLVVSLYFPLQALRLGRARRWLEHDKDAHVAIGHALQRVVSKGNRLFHDVEAGRDVVDNVVVGANGVYVVNVFARRRPGKDPGTARIRGNTLEFDDIEDRRAVEVSYRRAKLLGHALGKLLGSSVSVQSVIAVPGWEIGSSNTNSHLLVNEKTVVTLTGWTRADAYLMDEDVEKVCDYLARLCRGARAPGRQRPPSSRSKKARGAQRSAAAGTKRVRAA